MSVQAPKSTRNKARSWRKKIRFGVLYVLFLFVVAEVGARVYWRITAWVSPWHPSELVTQRFYPELGSRLHQEASDPHDDGFDILLLGGSVLHDDWGDIHDRLVRGLHDAGLDDARVFNLAVPAHTSRDSLLKYQWCVERNEPFDLVVVYHGINETRMNNCPPGMFREDYSHVSWYAMVNALHPQSVANWVLFPYTVRYAWVSLLDQAGAYAPRTRPKPEWMPYGASVHTEAAFEKNIRQIVEMAGDRGEAVVLVTFAYRVVEDPPEEFDPRQMPGYAIPDFKGACPIEIWGQLSHVTGAIDLHNGALRRLADRYAHVTLFDQAALMSQDPRYFCDICHFTRAGCERFVENLIPVIVDRYQAQKN